MIRLSVNINKIATLRNARGGNVPNVVKVAMDCERFGSEGITVHPRPDERHIRYQDVRDLRPVVKTEFNIEGFPSDRFLQLVKEIKPEQVTLVPDPPGAITSSQGWNTKIHNDFLKKVIAGLKENLIRTSIFVGTEKEMILYAADTGTDRVELYTEPYASGYNENRERAIDPFHEAAVVASESGLGINAGHDLSLENLQYFARIIPGLLEVSIGHALISDALYYGLENTIQIYRRLLVL